MDDDVLSSPRGRRETMRSCTSSFVYKEPIGKGPFVKIAHAQYIHGKTRHSHILWAESSFQKGKRPRLIHFQAITYTLHFSCCCSFDLILLDPPFLPKAKKRKRIKRRPLRLSTPAFKSTNITFEYNKGITHI